MRFKDEMGFSVTHMWIEEKILFALLLLLSNCYTTSFPQRFEKLHIYLVDGVNNILGGVIVLCNKCEVSLSLHKVVK